MRNERESGPIANQAQARPWWETRPFVAAMVLLAAVPLLYPAIPPLVDLPGHMGRYRVEMDLATSPDLRQFYSFEWALIGNLGVDLLVWPLGKLIGLEPAVKLIVLSIPPLTVAGMLWVAREVHHRLPPTVMFALPFAYSYPFQFGFVNFTLSIALAFLAFGLWLRLGRLDRTGLRAALFVPLSCLVWLTHVFGWGVLGLMAFSAEAVRQHDRGRGWARSGVRAAFHAAALAGPLLLMLAWRSGVAGGSSADWFNWTAKFNWVAMVLRDRWQMFDLLSLGATFIVFVGALVHPRLTLSRNLAFSALVLMVMFLLLPRIIFSSAYADMRMVPVVFAMVLLAIRFKAKTDLPTAKLLAIAGLAFLLIRTGGTTASLAIAANDQRAKLAALDQIPRGARLVHMVSVECASSWALPRNTHLGAMALVRRNAFSNDQWTVEGTNLLSVDFSEAGRFMVDPSQIVRPAKCVNAGELTLDRSLRALPPGVFDYLWLIDSPPIPKAWVAGWEPVRIANGSLLLKWVDAPLSADAAPRPKTPRTETAIGR